MLRHSTVDVLVWENQAHKGAPSYRIGSLYLPGLSETDGNDWGGGCQRCAVHVNNLVGDIKANSKDFYRYINSQEKDTQGIPPGAVARSEASLLGMQAAPSLIPMFGTVFRGDLVMKTFLRPFSLFL